MCEKNKLMIVDDDEDITSLLKIKLENTNRYQVVTTNRETEAVDLARRDCPDLILLDIDMPNISGGDIAKLLSKTESTKNIPILFSSSLVTKADTDIKGKSIGGHAMVSKSIKTSELIAIIDELMETSTACQLSSKGKVD